MDHGVIFANYSPVGDMTVAAVCFVIIIQLVFSYFNHSRSYRIFVSLVALLLVAAWANITYHMLAGSPEAEYCLVAYGMRCVYHAALFSIFMLFAVYIAEVTNLEKKRKLPYLLLSAVILIAVVSLDVYTTVRGSRSQMAEEGLVAQSQNIFLVGYAAFYLLLSVMMASVRKRLFSRVMKSFYLTMALSLILLLIQGFFRQSSFTVASFLFPILTMLYTLHANPYDAQLGAVDSRALAETVQFYTEKNRKFRFISLYMHALSEEGAVLPQELQATVRRFAGEFFRGAMLFQVDRGHMILLFTEKRNPDYEARTRRIFDAFAEEYRKYKYDFKIVYGPAIEEISRRNEYVSFIRSVQRGMQENSFHQVGMDDVQVFDRSEIILRELEDIYQKHDLNDPRVLAYCQPVLNIRTRRYDTAEALMRLRLDGLGLVFPNQFIPLAEENGYIHVLTEIILNKTCEEIRRLLHMGYDFSRISVNVSALELKDDTFCGDIVRIIDRNQIPGEKLAIELTESRSESDFLLMKNKITELRTRGIKFYLDDFGTGYSNMERIMELPFDIIKFDRSMLLASGSSDRSRQIVVNLAHMFAALNYAVLYEGVENESDERMCMGMDASYLQGFKYSRPVPISALERYCAARDE